MHIKQTIECLLGGLAEKRIGANARIVNEEIEIFSLPPGLECLGHGLYEGVKAGCICDIELEHLGLPSELFDLRENGLTFVGTFAISQNHVSSVTSQFDGRVAAETSASACDERDFIDVFHA